jgi:hypothetical protein
VSITSEIKNQHCRDCCISPTDAASADGERLCAVDALARIRDSGEIITWDADAPQLHWHNAHTTGGPGGALAVVTIDGPYAYEGAARETLRGAVTAWQGDLKVRAQSGHTLTLAEVWALLPAPAVFTLPGGDSRTFSTYSCLGDCAAALADHLTALPARITGQRRPVAAEELPDRRGFALPPILNERRG